MAANRKNELKRLMKKYRNNLKVLPEGRVYVKKKDKGNALIIRNGGKRKGAPLTNRYVSLKNDEAADFATKYYLERLMPVLQKEVSALEDFEKAYHPEEKYRIIENIPSDISALIIDPLMPIKELLLKWEQGAFKKNTMEYDDAANYRTMKGERVRSRAEIIIGDILFSLGIPYRYECLHMVGDKKYYPDFTVINPENGEKYYIEYFGMMGVESYRKKAFSKIREYNKTKDADKFIYIFEDEGMSLDTYEVKNLILRKLGMEEEIKQYRVARDMHEQIR